jgi:hypothetical protein
MDTKRAGITMAENNVELTDKQREDFWRSHGWSEDLSDAERAQIESQWDDADIEMALNLGY